MPYSVLFQPIEWQMYQRICLKLRAEAFNFLHYELTISKKESKYCNATTNLTKVLQVSLFANPMVLNLFKKSRKMLTKHSDNSLNMIENRAVKNCTC